MEQLIYWFASLLNYTIGSYGFGIVMVTIIVRIIITPLHLSMMKTNLINQERLSYIKPQMDELTAALKEATSVEEQTRIRQEQMALQQAAGVKLVSASGCLPIFIQLPLFSALYFAVTSSPSILGDTFLGIPLNQPSFILMILSSLFYFVQGLISQVGLSAEQKQAGRAMILMSPLMNVLFALTAPAGAALYWTVGGVFSCLTSLYTSFNQKPRLQTLIREEMEKNPIQLPKRKDVTPKQATKTSTSKNTHTKRRNEGKQQRR